MRAKPAFGILLAAWLVLGGGLAVWLIWCAWRTNPTNRDLELLKFGFALFQSVVIGSIAAMILEWFKRIQADRILAAERRDEWSKSARKAYDDIKKRRRLLQDILGKTTTSAAACTQAHAQLVDHGKGLIDSQLLLEGLLEEVEQSSNVKDQQATGYLSTMESNLNKLSDALRSRSPSQPEVERVGRFLDSTNFKRDFGEPYHQARSAFLRR